MRFLGSIRMAVPLLVIIAGVLGWGTLYEARFGTASVQRDVYRSWWFEGILGFLALNLAVAALQRYPWKRHHLPFVLAHIGIILILVGGILGGLFGVEGQMIIPEGQAQKTLRLLDNVIVVRNPKSGAERVIPTRFETRAWVQEPVFSVPIALEDQPFTLAVDKYYPDAVSSEQITNDGDTENPAVEVMLEQAPVHENVWLFARDPARFGVGWGQGHVLFLEPATSQELQALLATPAADASERGTVSITLPGENTQAVDLSVPERLGEPIPIAQTPYTVTFKDYFADFTITDQGISNRSDEPNNPAVAFVLTGPEGSDAHLLFAFHPDFPSMHAREHLIPVQVSYQHPAGSRLPPNAFAVLLRRKGDLIALLTDEAGARQVIDPLEIGKAYAHEGLEASVTVTQAFERARLAQEIKNRSQEVRAEMLHVALRDDKDHSAQAWIGADQPVELSLGPHMLQVEYRRATREMPVTIKLIDFRKTDYPGIQMAAEFESYVQLSDMERGTILMRNISMNKPLKYRGYSFFQSSFIDGPVQTTVLSVRSDPGTPLVYAGFIIVIAGVVAMFILRARSTGSVQKKRASR